MSTPQNPVGWFEIYVADMERAKAFYEQTFQQTLEELPAPDPSVQMLAFPFNPEESLPGACGALAKMEGLSPGTGGTLVYFSCKDCAEEAARAAAAGGEIIRPKFAIGDHGFISLIQDTEGNIIGLHSHQ